MATNYNQTFASMTPEVRSGVTACLSSLISELNQPQPQLTGTQHTSASSNGTRGGSSKQHAEAGHEGGLATGKKRGRRSNAEIQASRS